MRFDFQKFGKLFLEKIATKNSWGKNEIMKEFNEITIAVYRQLDEDEKY